MHVLDEGLREVNRLEDSLDDYDKKLEVRIQYLEANGLFIPIPKKSWNF